MSLVKYNPIQLQKLSEEELKRIIITDGLRVEDEGTDKTSLIRTILNFQDGEKSMNMPTITTSVLLSGPVDDMFYKMERFYNMKADMVNQLLQMSDAAIFALLEKMEFEVDLLADGYLLVNGINIPDRAALVWYLIGMRS